MTTRIPNILLGALVALCLPALAFSQGLSWETATSISMAGDHQLNTKSYYLPRMFKQGSDEGAVVYRLDKKMMYVIDYTEREYSEITFAELETYIKNANAETKRQIDELKKQLATMPEEQRKAMEQLMGAQMTAADEGMKVDVTKTSETRSISGYTCTKYVLKRGGEEAATIWTTKDVPGFAAMQEDFREFSRQMASQMSFNGWQMSEAMAQVDGFPVETNIVGMTATVSKVAKAAIAEKEFGVPAGFKKVPFEQMEQGRGGDRDDMPMDDGEGEGEDDDGGEEDDGGGF